MNIKKFIANSTEEAIQMVKKEMGSDAVILRTRTLGLAGGGGEREKKRIEVTAAVDYDAMASSRQDRKPPESDQALKRWQNVEMELKVIKEALLSAEAGVVLMPETYYNRVLRGHYANYKNFGLRPDVIRELMNESHEPDKERKNLSPIRLLQDSLAKVLTRIKTNGHENHAGRRKIYSFIGPTGVGKTTTLAKLAAISAVNQGKKVALITVDTFRVAAVAQLQAYARLMDVPLKVAVSSAELRKAIDIHKDRDFIFIDSAGGSPTKSQNIIQLKELFRIPEEIHHYLVLSSTTRYQNLLLADKTFEALPFKSYIFTKLDETEDVSSVLNFLISREKPVSYLTTGQQVPDDIEAASKKKVASLILAGMRERAEHRMNEVKAYGSSCRT